MDRRQFVKAGLATSALGASAARLAAAQESPSRRHYELRNYELRNDIDPGRLRAFYRDALLPALARAGAGTVALFTPDTGFPSQSLVAVIEYPSLAAVDTVARRLDADAPYIEARRAFETGNALPYIRYDARLMRAFSAHPAIEVPPGDASRSPRMFELRTYEARSASALERKIAMFNEGEITLFRSIGMTPVFFGENIFGTRLPSLTYMLTFDDIAARTKAWNTFGTHPEWRRISKDPRYDVLGAVSVTNVAYLSPLPFSPVR
ncbi:MAG: family containing protein [Gemmatimonadetes bacterium]|jgi:hypothetical protein|nr:family containing protein [Gemmatimonadota bacterium]